MKPACAVAVRSHMQSQSPGAACQEVKGPAAHHVKNKQMLWGVDLVPKQKTVNDSESGGNTQLEHAAGHASSNWRVPKNVLQATWESELPKSSMHGRPMVRKTLALLLSPSPAAATN